MSITIQIEPPFEPSVDSCCSGIKTIDAAHSDETPQKDCCKLKVDSIINYNLNSFRTVTVNPGQSIRESRKSIKSIRSQATTIDDSCRCLVF